MVNIATACTNSPTNTTIQQRRVETGQTEHGVHLNLNADWRSVVSQVVEGKLGQVGKA